MKILQAAVLALAIPALFFACSAQVEEDNSHRGRLGKADLIGSCEGSCDGQSASGNCWCDSQCAEYGDCCEDATTVCELSECTFGNNSESIGCGQGQVCAPGICKAFCPEDMVGNCCAPNTCIPDPNPTCEAIGGSCKSSPIDVTFPASCIKDFNMAPSDASCEAFNQTCCVPVDCPLPTPPKPGVDFCPDGAIPSTVVEDFCIIGYKCPKVCPELTPPPPNFCPDGVFPDAVMDEDGDCVIGFECPEANACEDNGGFCVNGFISECPADTTLLNESCGGSVEQTCCKSFFPLPPVPASCEGNCGGQVGDKVCFCDSACTGYGDCCDDYQDICVN